MPDPGIDAFHFLRPWWLLGIPLALWLHTRLRRVMSASDQWRGIIAPELLAHLVVGRPDRSRVRPYQVLSVLLVVMSAALAGPTWQREASPFSEDRAALVVVLELTDSMLGIDQPPTRLERAKQKIRDLLTLRQGAKSALVAYSGSAHVVLPLTDDTELIELYLESLTPAVMPMTGDRPDLALSRAAEILSGESAGGTIVFLSDGIDASFAGRFAELLTSSDDQLLVLGFGTDAGGPRADQSDVGLVPPVDSAGLAAVADAGGGWATAATVDDSDVRALQRRARQHLADVIEPDSELQWHDAGYYLVWPLALIALAWFRRGWTVQWQ